MRHSLFLVFLMALSACGSATDTASNTEVLRAFAASATGRMKAPETVAPITRATLAQVVTPVMLVKIDKTGQEALIAEIQTNGGVSTWSSIDDITISFRNSVIVATRGFGADLMAAAVPAISRSSGGGTGHTRVHTLLNGEDNTVRTRYACTLQNAGSKIVNIVQIAYETTHIIESCAADGLRFQNEYWFSGDQKMRKSRQWISPEVGFLTIEDVRR